MKTHLLHKNERIRLVCDDAFAFTSGLPDNSIGLTFFSPPYEDQRSYGIGFALKGQDWVNWLRPIIRECCRVTKGLVVVNAACPVRNRRYSPALEWLVSDLTRQDGLVCGPSPYAWTKNGLPGSGQDQYHRRDWEPLYCFAKPASIPLRWSNNLAFGGPPVYRPGGAMNNRGKDGERKDNTRTRKNFEPPEICNPGNVIHATVGGENLGSKRAHHGEAPMTLSVPERFVCWYCKPNAIVYDPMCGTGTTGEAALNHGRKFIGCDIRPGNGGIATAKQRLFFTTPTFLNGVA